MPRYVLDSNVYIEAERNPEVRERLTAFTQANASTLYLSTVVMHELLAGVRDAERQAEMERQLLTPYRNAARIVPTDERVWKDAANICRAFRFDLPGSESRLALASFRNDILIAASCRRVGATLITTNSRDFAAIREINGLHYAEPFP